MNPAIVTLISTLLPTAANLILTLVHPDGTQTVVAILNNVDTANATNLAELQKFSALLGSAKK